MKNLPKLRTNVYSEDILSKIDKVIVQVEEDFKGQKEI
jgi:hypothetical protein